MKEKKSKSKINEPLIKSSNLFPVVGVGASAGGLNAFRKLLKAIPDNSGIAWVLVQHLSPSQESLLPDLLQKITNIPVLEITDDINVQPDHIYIIPANKILMANDGTLQLSPRPAPGKDQRNLPIDTFFASLAEVHQSHSIGVVLSGTASDGTSGLKAIKDHGGITFAQDQESSEYKDMPRSAVQAGVVDFILSPEEIPQKLLEITKIAKKNGHDGQTVLQGEPDAFKQILSLVRIRKGTDFTYYKQTTIRRRILRRMALSSKEEASDYLKYLRENKTEQDALYQDLLIPVTSFFRDSESFDHLCKTVLPKILENKENDEILRIWVAGCSTGEEAYSIAICLRELIDDKPLRVQIFGTDISEPAIAKARAGVYAKNEVENVSAHRLREFFTKTKANGNCQVNKQLRDTCVFAVHNFLKDPPFGRIDLISCRNVLIYMEPYLQKKALNTFHYSLKSKGFLFLGRSETISSVPDLFATLHKRDKLFSRKDAPGRIGMPVIRQPGEQNFREQGLISKRENIRTDFQKTADDFILSKYTPAGVVVNEMMDIVHYRGSTSDYLQQPAGKPSHNLLKLAKSELAFELRNILHKVKKGLEAKKNQAVIKENIPLKINGSRHTVAIEGISLPNVAEPHYLILFHHTSLTEDKAAIKGNKKTARSKASDKDLRIQQLEQELERTHEDMRGIADDQEAAYEELQSANEELESGSEELRSLNEELETSKEELQSTNEELTVVNQQLIGLNQQVTEERDYADGIISTVREPLLVLDKHLRVKTASNSFYKTFLVNEQETQGKRIYDLGNNQWDIPALRSLLERVLPEKESFSDFEVNHNLQSIGQRTMLLNAREIPSEEGMEKLILLAIEDITERHQAAKLVEESEKRFNNLLMQSPFAFGILKGEDMVLQMANNAIKESWGKGPDLEGKKLLDILPEMKDQAFPALLQSVYKTGTPHYAHETLAKVVRKGVLEDVYYNFVYQPYREVDGTISGIVIIANEVTPQALANKKIKESEEQFRHLADSMPQMVWTADTEGNADYFNKTWLDYTGLSLEDLKDWGWKKIVHPDDWDETKKRWQHSVDTGEDFELEHRLLNKDGSYLWHLSRTVAYKGNNEKIKMWMGTNTEIHQQKKQKEELEKAVVKRTYELLEANTELLQSEERYHSMVEEVQDYAIILLDKDGNIQNWNKGAEKIKGYKAEEIIGKNFSLFYTKEDHASELPRRLLKKAVEEGRALDENWSVRKDGTKFWGSIVITALHGRDNNIFGFVKVTRDLTATKIARDEIIAQKEQLKAKNTELQTMNIELESFAYISSHDLQEPLRKIQTFATRIEETEKKNLSEKGLDYFKRMKDSAYRMQILIQDLLSYSRTANAEKRFVKTDLKKVVEEVKKDLSEIIEEKNATIETHLLCEVHIIPFQFHQAIYNLISNSLKFSSPGKPPHIIIKDELAQGGELQSKNTALADRLISEKQYCHITVSDSGIGFEPKFKDKIFEVFQRLFTKDEYPGTGIGLSIVKKIIENHNGIITAAGELNRGAAFDIYIPV